MKHTIYSSVLLFSFAVCGSAFAASNIVANDTRYDVRYISNPKRPPDDGYQALLRQTTPWRNFVNAHTTWSVLFNEENQKPRIAYGAGIMVTGATVQERAMNFIHTYLLGYQVPLADISLYSITTHAEKYDHANFIQTYKGILVLDSRLKVKMTKAGEVVYFKTDVFSDVKVDITPSITGGAAVSYASAGITEKITSAKANTELKILPVPRFRRYEYHLVYETYVETHDDINNVPAKYYTLVDAHDGKILYRKNLVDHFCPSSQANVTVNGTLYPTHPYNSTQVLGLPHMKITSGSSTFYTDAQGVAAGVPTGNATLIMEGLWCDVRTGSTTPSMTSNISGNPAISFDNNSTDRERTAYYHINIIHDFMKSLPQLSGFTAMDSPMNTIVDVSGSCNAFYNGNVNFYAAGGGCNATALLADVMYHEYGHGLNYDIYSYYGQTFSNGAMGEGYSDIWAASITNNPVIGIGFYTSNQNGIRRYDPPNRKVYPQDLVGEVHADGEIIAGAWWEVNLNMGNNLGFMTDLFIKTFPDGVTGPDGSEGTVFMDVLISALQADDNDGNICNGTPNSSAILPAFSAHGITLYSNITLTHTPVLSANPATSIPITASATAQSSGPCTLSGGNLFWRTASSQSWNTSSMTYSNPTLTGSIPGQPAGTIVEYYIEVGGLTSPSGITGGNIPHYIMVGFTPNSNLYDDMGDAQGWGNWNIQSLGNTSGTWIIDIPIPSYTNPSAQTGLVQVGTQATPGGQYCAVTANASNASQSIGTADIDAGTTRLESPVFSLSGFTNPAITYYRSFSNNSGSNPGTDPWVAEISNDNGSTWTKVEHTYYSDVNWRRFAFKVLDYTTLTSQMKVRFTASDSTIAALPNNGQSVSEAAMDEFQVWDGPLTTGILDPEIATVVVVFPNPSSNNAVISFSFDSEQEISLAITNALGQIIWHKDLGMLKEGSWSYTIDVRNFSAGIYQLHIKSPSGTVSRKLSVAR